MRYSLNEDIEEAFNDALDLFEDCLISDCESDDESELETSFVAAEFYTGDDLLIATECEEYIEERDCQTVRSGVVISLKDDGKHSYLFNFTEEWMKVPDTIQQFPGIKSYNRSKRTCNYCPCKRKEISGFKKGREGYSDLAGKVTALETRRKHSGEGPSELINSVALALLPALINQDTGRPPGLFQEDGGCGMITPFGQKETSIRALLTIKHAKYAAGGTDIISETLSVIGGTLKEAPMHRAMAIMGTGPVTSGLEVKESGESILLDRITQFGADIRELELSATSDMETLAVRAQAKDRGLIIGLGEVTLWRMLEEMLDHLETDRIPPEFSSFREWFSKRTAAFDSLYRRREIDNLPDWRSYYAREGLAVRVPYELCYMDIPQYYVEDVRAVLRRDIWTLKYCLSGVQSELGDSYHPVLSSFRRQYDTWLKGGDIPLGLIPEDVTIYKTARKYESDGINFIFVSNDCKLRSLLRTIQGVRVATLALIPYLQILYRNGNRNLSLHSPIFNALDFRSPNAQKMTVQQIATAPWIRYNTPILYDMSNLNSYASLIRPITFNRDTYICVNEIGQIHTASNFWREETTYKTESLHRLGYYVLDTN